MKRDFQFVTARSLATGLSLMAVSVSAAALDLDVNGTKAKLYGYAELNMIYDVNA